MTTAPRIETDALVALDREIDQRRSALEASAASLIDPQRLKGVVLAAFSRRPELWECDPVTIARAVVEAAQYGLEPTGAIGGAHLVPFKNKRTGRKEAQLIIDYRGYVQLARRSAEVAKVEARVVRERDEFYVEEGTASAIIHKPYLGQDDPGVITHVYAVITYRDGTTQFDFDTRAWVDTIRSRSRASDNGPWVTDYAEMAKKSIVRRLMKLAPLTVEARQAIESEEQFEAQAEPVVVRRPSSPALRAVREHLGIAEPVTVQVDEDTTADLAPDAPDEADRPVEAAEGLPLRDVVACDAVSPFDDDEHCGLAPEHKGIHRSTSATWPLLGA